MAKQLIAIRLSPKLVSQLRKMAAKQGTPHQSLIHERLKKNRFQGGVKAWFYHSYPPETAEGKNRA